MKKNILTKSQVVALLVTLRKELNAIFANAPELEKVKGGSEKKKRIIDDLGYLIKDGFKIDPEDPNIYEIFNKFQSQ